MRQRCCKDPLQTRSLSLPIITSEPEPNGKPDQVTPSVPEGVLVEDVDMNWSPTHTPTAEGELQLASEIFDVFEEGVPLFLPSLLFLSSPESAESPTSPESHLLHLHWCYPAPALQCSLASLSPLLFQIQPVPQPCLCWFLSVAQLTLKSGSHCVILARFGCLRQILKTLKDSYNPWLTGV